MDAGPEIVGNDTAAADRLSDLFQREHSKLVLSALVVLNNRADAEDAVSETFGRLLTKADLLPEGPGLVPYVWKSVLNQARNLAVRRRQHDELPEDAAFIGEAPEAEVVRYQEYRAVLAAARTLPDRQLAVLVLRYWHDLSIEQVAAALEISPGSVKTHAHRALRAVRKSLEGRGYGPLD